MVGCCVDINKMQNSEYTIVCVTSLIIALTTAMEMDYNQCIRLLACQFVYCVKLTHVIFLPFLIFYVWNANTYKVYSRMEEIGSAQIKLGQHFQPLSF